MSSGPEVQTVAVIPAFNEERTVGNAVRASLRADTIDAVICVDDGSTDKTGASANQAAAREHALGNDTSFHLHAHGDNLGKAEAMQSGVALAQVLGGDSLRTVVFLDADLSAIQSRETPYNRYWHQVMLDRVAGRTPIGLAEEEAAAIEDELANILAGYIDELTEPVRAETKIMTIGLLARNQMADRFRGKLDWGMLAGTRAVSIDLWNNMLAEFEGRGIRVSGFEIEAALNSYTRLRRDEAGIKLNRGIGKVLMKGVVHVGSRYKAGSVVGGLRRMATIHSAAARSFVRYAVRL